MTLLLTAVVCIGVLFGVHPVWAGAPTDRIRQTTDKILSIVTDPALKEPSREEERRKLIRRAVDERFDWEEMSRRSLGTHWSGRTAVEKKEFVDLFGKLLERTYLDRVEGYAGEKVNYLGESVEQDYGVVDVKIVTTKNTEIPVKYRLRKKGDDWFVYDISIEGVSLVNNYRVQFNNILARGSYKELVKRLQEKVKEK
ncbi:MAG: ABC transporter substrate-binding protein [Deltaproteobacteria bacterium]|nr:ABC transporter substrate-binding protein [Deltaproteobacteria bacterium]